MQVFGKDHCRSERLSARHLRDDGPITTIDHCSVLYARRPIEAPSAGADQAAITAHVEAVAAAGKVAVANATTAVASEAAILKWGRACHNLYAALSLLPRGQSLCLHESIRVGAVLAGTGSWPERS